ncbi:peptidoglycan-binding protein, partial [Patescibacteria group bacterium]|nr:peptidoglycan-binding protein [Patescibacteria group bacterium]
GEDNSSAPTSNEPPAPAPAPAPATCSDGIKNQSETGTDCGGPCSACAVLTPTPTPTQTQTQTPTQAQAQTPTQAQAQTPTTGGSSVSSDTPSTISVRLNASPNIGHSPLNVNLDAFVSGTAVGPVNYTFYCDRNDSGVNITTPYSAKYDSITSITNSFPCVYSSPGVYTAKVIIERGNALPTEVRATITALAPGEVIPTAPQPAAETTPTTTTPAITPPMAEAAIFTKAMYPGFKHEEVTKLQQYLSQDASLYPEKEITGYFGELTLKAVQRFQTKYSIVSSGTSATTGYGLVGPATRAKLNEVFGSTSFDKAQDKPLTTGGAISAPTPTSAETEALVNQLIAQIRLLQEQLMQILTQLTQLLQQQIQQKLGQ